MKIVSRKSTNLDLDAILADLTDQLPVEAWSVGFIFISSFSREATIQISNEFQKRVNCANLLGCSATGVITSTNEIENQPAVSVILMQFDQVTVQPFYLTQSEISERSTHEQWYEYFDIYPHEKPKFFILSDPYSIDITNLLVAFNKTYPLCPVIGGLVSGGIKVGENTLFLNNTFYDEGCIGLSMQGDVRVETVVSQGCRPIGESYIVTYADGNVIYELGGRPFYLILEEVLNKQATDRDRALSQEAIFIGIAMDEYKHELKTGDFLIRPVIGLDQQSGAGAIADNIKTGQTIQFHVRDAVSATEDLMNLMNTQVKRHTNEQPQGALIFSCNGRGKNLFNIPDHDLGIIKNHIGELPIAGFFCVGEIGPVGGQNFAHGFTSSIALFYPLGIGKTF
ncbi:MAG: FIST C-terminal domain-containing protein [Candidatus Omnitrophica bacterium]|nr:FIST C-terminal domain-containing protein [Candidatus Omnitrophota bacterium]